MIPSKNAPEDSNDSQLRESPPSEQRISSSLFAEAPPREEVDALSPLSRISVDGAPADRFNEFDYRPVPALVSFSLMLGLCSILTIFSEYLLVFPLAGVIVGLLCVRMFRTHGDVFSGRKLALTGLILSSTFLVVGPAVHVLTYINEVPEGFERVRFATEISAKGFEVREGKPQIHPDVQALDGKPIFLKGYMYPVQQTEGLTSFVFVKDNLQCCAGGNPAVTDMILVRMSGGKTVDYTQVQVSVAGIFKTKASQGLAGLSPVYEMDGRYFSRSKTSH